MLTKVGLFLQQAHSDLEVRIPLRALPLSQGGVQEIMSGCASSLLCTCAHVPSCSSLAMTVLTLLYGAGSPALHIHRFKGVESQRFFFFLKLLSVL